MTRPTPHCKHDDADDDCACIDNYERHLDEPQDDDQLGVIEDNYIRSFLRDDA